MLLSHRYNFLFVHIAKTGGTSVRAALNPYKWHSPYAIPQFLASRLSHMTGHKIGSKFPRHAKIIAAKEMLEPRFFDDLFKFVFVRNPWDLQVSSYHHLKKEHPNVVADVDNFQAFVRKKLDPNRAPDYLLDTSMQLQSEYIVDLNGNVLVDFIGRYENLQEDFNHVCETVGIKQFDLPHRRKAANRKTYRDYYDDATAEAVEKHYKIDIERFGYTFD